MKFFCASLLLSSAVLILNEIRLANPAAQVGILLSIVLPCLMVGLALSLLFERCDKS